MNLSNGNMYYLYNDNELLNFNMHNQLLANNNILSFPQSLQQNMVNYTTIEMIQSIISVFYQIQNSNGSNYPQQLQEICQIISQNLELFETNVEIFSKDLIPLFFNLTIPNHQSNFDKINKNIQNYQNFDFESVSNIVCENRDVSEIDEGMILNEYFEDSKEPEVAIEGEFDPEKTMMKPVYDRLRGKPEMPSQGPEKTKLKGNVATAHFRYQSNTRNGKEISLSDKMNEGFNEQENYRNAFQTELTYVNQEQTFTSQDTKSRPNNFGNNGPRGEFNITLSNNSVFKSNTSKLQINLPNNNLNVARFLQPRNQQVMNNQIKIQPNVKENQQKIQQNFPIMPNSKIVPINKFNPQSDFENEATIQNPQFQLNFKISGKGKAGNPFPQNINQNRNFEVGNSKIPQQTNSFSQNMSQSRILEVGNSKITQKANPFPQNINQNRIFEPGNSKITQKANPFPQNMNQSRIFEPGNSKITQKANPYPNEKVVGMNNQQKFLKQKTFEENKQGKFDQGIRQANNNFNSNFMTGQGTIIKPNMPGNQGNFIQGGFQNKQENKQNFAINTNINLNATKNKGTGTYIQDESTINNQGMVNSKFQNKSIVANSIGFKQQGNTNRIFGHLNLNLQNRDNNNNNKDISGINNLEAFRNIPKKN
jgi:hypothetical protein